MRLSTEDREILAHTSFAAFDKKGERIVLGSKVGPAKVWDVQRGVVLHEIPMQRPMAACFNPADEDIVYAVSVAGAVVRLDTRTGDLITTPEKTAKPEQLGLVCNPAGTLLVTGASGRYYRKPKGAHICVLRADTLEQVYSISDEPAGTASWLAFSPSGDRLYEGSESSQVSIWVPGIFQYQQLSTQGQGLAAEGEGSQADITVIAVDPTGAYVCCGKSDGRVCIFDTKTGDELQEIYRFGGIDAMSPWKQPCALSWAPDGLMVAMGAAENRITVVALEPLADTTGKPPSRASWKCAVKVDDFKFEVGGGLQLLLNETKDRFIAYGANGAALLSLTNEEDSGVVGVSGVLQRPAEPTPAWLTHPHDRTKLIRLAGDHVRIYAWKDLTELTPAAAGIPVQLVRSFKQVYAQDIWAVPSFDNQFIVTSTRGGIIVAEGEQTRASVWAASSFVNSSVEHMDTHASTTAGRSDATETSDSTANPERTIASAYQIANVPLIDRIVGVFRDRVVFLTKETLWVCSVHISNTDLEIHFPLPREWGSDSVVMPTPSGDFVLLARGKVTIVENRINGRK